MTESIYKEYQNKYYNPNDNDKKPGDNDNWKSIQKGFHDIGSTQLETSEGLTLGKGTEDETSVTAGELEEIKNPSQLETSGGLTLGKGTENEVSVSAAELGEMKQGGDTSKVIRLTNSLESPTIENAEEVITWLTNGETTFDLVFVAPTTPPVVQELGFYKQSGYGHLDLGYILNFTCSSLTDDDKILGTFVEIIYESAAEHPFTVHIYRVEVNATIV